MDSNLLLCNVNDSENILLRQVARIRDYDLEGVENFDQLAEDLIVIPGSNDHTSQFINIRWTGCKFQPNEPIVC